jgi:hypothetical protein
MVDCTHHYVEVADSIFICKKCAYSRWFPTRYPSAVVYAQEIERWGADEAYKRRLQKMPKVELLLEQLNSGNFDALKGYTPEVYDEIDKMVAILKRKGLDGTILGEL